MEKSYLEKIQIHKENKLAGLHPGAKLWVVILYTVCTFILNSIHLTEVGLSLAVIPWFLVVLILCATSGAMKKCVKAFKAVAFIALVIFVVQTFIVPGGEVLWRFGILRICEKGLRTAISLSFMVMDIAGIFVWYFQTTSNKEIARALEESGMNYKAVYVFTSSLSMIDILSGNSKTIMNAQKARGVETEGNMIVRAKAFFPTLVMLCCIPFAKKEIQGAKQEGEEEQEQQVKPLRAKKMSVAFGAIIVGDIAYCAVVNGIMTYTSSFAESLGIASSTAAFMLTVYNVGCFVGSMAFVVILRKVREQTVLLVNSVGGVAAIILMLLVDQIPVYFACLAIAGFFLGVLFSVYVTIATRIDYKHVSRAASLMGTAGGGSDILTPVITGAMVGLWGVRIAYVYVIIMSAVSILAAIVLRMNTSEEEDL